MRSLFLALLLVVFAWPAQGQDRTGEAVQALDSAAGSARSLGDELGRVADLLREPEPPIEPEPEAGPAWLPIAYTRTKRNHKPLHVRRKDGSTFEVVRPDLYQLFPEVAHIRQDFSVPGQLVLLKKDATEVVLFDCVTQEVDCLPTDVIGHPDGKRAMFVVYYTRGRQYPLLIWPHLPVEAEWSDIAAEGIESRIFEVLLQPPYTVTAIDGWVPGQFDTGPVYLPNGRIAYLSDRAAPDKAYPPIIRGINHAEHRRTAMRLWIRDERRDRLVAPHDVGGSLHPFLLRDGRITMARLMWDQEIPYRVSNGQFGGINTLSNSWWVFATSDGGRWRSLFGAHAYGLAAPHFFGQRANGDFLTAHYYRGNNKGLGEVLYWPLEHPDVEGRSRAEHKRYPSPQQFLNPRGLSQLALWASPSDNAPKVIRGEYVGKIGYPDGIEDEGANVLLTYGRGKCIPIACDLEDCDAEMRTQPRGCDMGIWRTTQVPSVDPSDMRLVKDEPEWNEFAARYVGPRQPAKDLRLVQKDQCYLDMASMKTETHPDPFDPEAPSAECGRKHCAVAGTRDEDIKAIRLWEVVPNSQQPKNWDYEENTWGSLDHLWGYENALIGDVPVQPDGSASARIPCEVPFRMAGVNSQGLAVRVDQVPRSLRYGERETCGGCHLHSEQGPPFGGTLASMIPETELPETGVPTLEWGKDIKPWLEENCAACHVDDAWVADYSSLVWDRYQRKTDHPQKLRDGFSGDTNYHLHGDKTSLYVDRVFALESYVYWKCVGRRTDGRTDDQYKGDIDYGAEHPALDGVDCTTLGQWIDAGAYRAKGEAVQ